MKLKLILVVTLVWASGVFGGVFDDARIWVRTADDKNGDGWVKTTRNHADTKDFPNSLKGGDASDLSHVWSARGPYTNIHVVVGKVVNPLAQTTNESAYLHFDQPVLAGGSYYGGLYNVNFIPAVTNADPRTVYLRMRLDSFMATNVCANLVTLGHSASSGKGAGWKLMLVPDEEGASFHFKVVNGRPKDTTTETGVGTKEFTKCTENSIYRLSTNIWVDVVFACGCETGTWQVDVYSCREGGVFCADSQGIGWNSTKQEDSGTYLANCWLGSVGSDYNLSTIRDAFRGDIAAFAYWDRRLTEEEAYVVMAAPRNDVFALGVKNGSADEFAGKAGAVVDVAATNAFLAVPASIATDDSFSLSFTLDEKSGYGLPQAFRIAAAPGSSSATFYVIPNELTDQAQEIEVSSASDAIAVFRARAFVQGRNTLKLTRIDRVDQAFVPDCFALGGSWSIGRRDDSHAEFAYTTAADTTRFTRTADANWKHTVINLSISGTYSDNRLYAWVDPVLAASRRFRFVARMRPLRDKELERRPMSIDFRLNSGTARSISLTAENYDGYRDFNFDFEPGELVGGSNCFELTNTSEPATDSPKSEFISFDCRQLKVLPDPNGMNFLIK